MQVFWTDNQGEARAANPASVFRNGEGVILAVVPARSSIRGSGPAGEWVVVEVDFVLPARGFVRIDPPPRKIEDKSLSIKAEIRALDKKIDCDPFEQSDIDRLELLIELMYLRKPINFDPNWRTAMHYGLCPCPGVRAPVEGQA